jgi:hypothetical protein
MPACSMAKPAFIGHGKADLRCKQEGMDRSDALTAVKILKERSKPSPSKSNCDIIRFYEPFIDLVHTSEK